MASTSDIEHLVRRTEFVARPARVQYLLGLGTIEAAVADILNVPADPASAAFTQPENWQRGEQLTHFWLDRMAHDSPKPIQEKMGFFWHGHFCSEFGKVGSAELMREQIDTFRYGALGNLRTLALEMSTQVAMLRYLDNNQNRQTSPNQNFARELMELFLLGVGNYTEADVEAATAAWTGHTDQWDTDQYVWRADWHDGSRSRFLGRHDQRGRRSHDPRLRDDQRDPRQRHRSVGRQRGGESWPSDEGGRRRVLVEQAVDRVRRHESAGRRDRCDARGRDHERLRDQAVAAGDADPRRVLHDRREARAGPIARRVRRRCVGGHGPALERGDPAVADARDGATPAVPAERQRLEAQRLLGQRQRDVETHRYGSQLRLAQHDGVLERRRSHPSRPRNDLADTSCRTTTPTSRWRCSIGSPS